MTWTFEYIMSPVRIELALLAPEANALSAELRGRLQESYWLAGFSSSLDPVIRIPVIGSKGVTCSDCRRLLAT